MDGKEIIHRCALLAWQTTEPGQSARGYLSEPMHAVHRLVQGWMEAAGLRTRVDAVGNLRGVYGEGPRLMIGSELEGALGVLIAIALVERRPACSVEVAALAGEQPAGFGAPFIGSRAMIGSPVMEARVLAAMREFGLDPGRIAEAELEPEVTGYLEFHTEKGGVLEGLGRPLGVVEAIAGASRWELRFAGESSHAGATPMSGRRDALAGAAEWIGLVEHLGMTTDGLVATVGCLEAAPGAANVIPGTVRVSLDARHALDEVRERAVNVLLDGAESICGRRGLTVDGEPLLEQPTAALDFAWVEKAVAATGYPVHRMWSGAGHAAMMVAQKLPASVVLLRGPEDVEAALAVGWELLRTWPDC